LSRILITGGTGFIGSNLAKRLVEDGHEITIIDNLFTSSTTNIQDIVSNVKYFNIDLSNKHNIDDLDNIFRLGEFDICYHLAASIGVKLVQEQMSKTLQNSFNINNNLFPLFEKYNVKVIYSSTSEVYGESEEGGSKETDILKIFAPGKPRGSYACSKLMSEFLLKSYTFPNVIVRFFNVVGKGQVSTYGHVLPMFIEKARAGESLPVFGDGEQIRSYCHILDAVEMLVLLMDSKHDGEIYNIGNDKNICTVKQLASGVIRLMNSTSEIEYIPFEDALGSNFEEIFVRFPCTDKIKEYYTCKYNLETIIRGLRDVE